MYFSFRTKWLRIHDPADLPSDIRWQNVPYSSGRRFIRKFFSIIIALIVILASFGIVIGAKYAQMEIDKTFNSNVDCGFISYDLEEMTTEYNDDSITLRNKVKTYCYCQSYMFSNGITKTQTFGITGSTGSKTPCYDWVEKYIYSQSLMVATFILVPFINVVLSILLRLLTEMERNKSVSINASSLMWKSFLLQFINTVRNNFFFKFSNFFTNFLFLYKFSIFFKFSLILGYSHFNCKCIH